MQILTWSMSTGLVSAWSGPRTPSYCSVNPITLIGGSLLLRLSCRSTEQQDYWVSRTHRKTLRITSPSPAKGDFYLLTLDHCSVISQLHLHIMVKKNVTTQERWLFCRLTPVTLITLTCFVCCLLPANLFHELCTTLDAVINITF